MPPQKKTDEGLSMKNTKRELLEAYEDAMAQLREKAQTQLKPEQTIQAKKDAQVVAAASGLSADKVSQGIGQLRNEVNKMLSELAEKLTDEVQRFETTQRAIAIKERELKDVYEIERSAATLAALIESQHEKSEAFEDEMAEKREALTLEIETLRQRADKERSERQAEAKDWEQQQARQRKRQEEEYRYAFEREKQLARDKFEDEKARLLAENEAIASQTRTMKEQTEKELQEREQRLAEREGELESLQAQVQAFPERLEAAVAKAVKETTERAQIEAKYRQELMEKEFEGERNVLTSRIQSLEKTVREQSEQIARLAQQQEAAYQKVQDVAVKAIEGASKAGSFEALQRTLRDQPEKKTNDRS
jgi:hypothetical protein